MIKSFVRGAAGAAVFVLAVAGTFAAEETPAEKTAPEMVIYDSALAPGWDNWSWAKAELSIELKGSPRRPIKVEAGGWQALYLHHAPFSTTGLRIVSFLIQGSVPDGEVRVFMLTDGKTNGEGKLVKLTNTGWTKVEIPLVTLGAEDKLVDGLWIQNASANDLPKFYVTDIKLQ